MKDKLLRLEQLKQFEKSLKEEMATLSEEIIQTMTDQNAKETPQLKEGKFILASKRVWDYSDTVKEAETNVKNLQSLEQADGRAVAKESKYLRYVRA